MSDNPEITTLGEDSDSLDSVILPPQENPDEDPDPDTVLLTKEESEEFLSALEIGRKVQTTLVCGRRVMMKTINTDDELIIGLLIKKWVGTDSYNRAYKTALMAACTVEIDGEPLTPRAISDEEDEEVIMTKKFEKCRRYYPFFVDAVYEEIIAMEQSMKPLLEKLYLLGKKLS